MSAIGRIGPIFIFPISLLAAAGLSLELATRPARTPAVAAPPASLPAIRPARPVPIFGFLHLPDGTPLADKSVLAVDAHGSHVVASAPWTTKYGAFALDRGLRPGVYTVYVPGMDRSLSPRRLVVKESPYIVLDLSVKAGTVKISPASTIRASRTVIFGLVARPNGLPPVSPNVLVEVTRSKGSPGPKGLKEQCLAGKSGAFVLPNALAPGTYAVTAINGQGSTVARVNCVVPEPQRPYMVLTVRAGSSSIFNRASAAPAGNGSVHGRLIDPAGRPVVDGVVGLVNEAQGRVYAATTDKDGRYVIDHVLPGRYAACASSSPGYLRNAESVVEVVTVKSGRAEKDFTLRTPRRATSGGPYVAPTGKGSMCGRVLDAAGRPVVGGMVDLINEERGLAYHAFTGRGGRYIVEHVLPGPYVARAIAPMGLREPGAAEIEPVMIVEGRLKEDFRLRKASPLAPR